MRRFPRVPCALYVVCLSMLVWPLALRAATITVDNCAFDPNTPTTLPYAVANASDGDTINFSVNCSGASAIVFTDPLFIHYRGVTIDGTGHSIELSGGWDGTYITDPNDPNVGYPSNGGLLFSLYSDPNDPKTDNFKNLTMENANGLGPHGGGAGAISNNHAIVYVDGCTFKDNVGNFGGAIFTQSGSPTTITNSTFVNNQDPGGIAPNTGHGGALYSSGTLNVTNSTFYNNRITGNGVGIGGAINVGGGSATITACTFTGNSSIQGGAIDGNATVKNSIIYGNSASTGPDVDGTFSSDGTNLIGSTSGSTGFTSDIVGEDPLLDSLGDHGGQTQTMPLLPGSAAIDAIAAANCQTSTDQRGVSRPINTKCDIGAFESHGFSMSLAGGNNQSTVINTSFATPLSVTLTASDPNSPYFEGVDGGAVTFTAPGSGASSTFSSNPASISSGSASATATANGSGGAYTVTASAAGASSSVDFSLTNIVPTRTLSETVSGPGSVTASGATPTSGSISSCTSSCSADYLEGSGVTLTGNPSTGAEVSSWGADCNGFSGTSGSVTMDANHSCTTTFAYLPPTISGGPYSTAFGTALNGTLTLTDPPGGTLTVSLTSGVSSGTLTGPSASGAFTYTPNHAFYGSDSFTVKVTSSVSGQSTSSTIGITVDDPLAPTANPQSLSMIYTQPLDITLSATLPPGAASVVHTQSIATLSYAIVSGPSHGTISNFDPSAGTLTYTSDYGWVGGDSFTYTATYGPSTSAPATVTIHAYAPPVPALDERAMALLGLLLVLAASWVIRR